MAPCLPFTSCFSGWFARTSRNEPSNCFAGNGGGGSSRRVPVDPQPVARMDARFRRMLRRKRIVEMGTDLDLPEPVDKFPEGVLKHWAPRSRCCEAVLEEIRLRAPVDSRVSLEKVAKLEHEAERRNLLTRCRRLFVREKTPEELEIKELRKEKKAVIKYLKGKNLYNRRMTYEQMKDLKAIAERSFRERDQDQDVQEIEMKEMKSASVPGTPEAIPEPVEVQVPKPAVIQKPEPIEVQEPESPVESNVNTDEFKAEQKALLRPEGPTEETEGNQIHPGTGLPISAPIYIPGVFRTWPMVPIPVLKDNMLIHILPGDIPCVQCNPEAVIVQAVINEEPKMDDEKDSNEEKNGAVQQLKDDGEYPSPSPPPKSDKSWKTLVNIYEEVKFDAVDSLQDEGEPIGCAVTAQSEATQQPKEDQDLSQPPTPPFEDGATGETATPPMKPEEPTKDCKIQPPSPNNVKPQKPTEDQEFHLPPTPESDTSSELKKDGEEFRLPPPPANDTSLKPTVVQELPPPENDKAFEPKKDDEDILLPALPENDTSMKSTTDQEPSVIGKSCDPKQYEKENYTAWKPTEQTEFPPLPPPENDKPWKTMIIPGSNHEEAKFDEEMEPLLTEEEEAATGGSLPAEAGPDEAVHRPKQFEEMSSPLPEKKNYLRPQTVTVFAEIHGEPSKDEKKQESTDGVLPPPLPPKKHIRRIARYKRQVNWADVDKIEVDPTYDQEEEEIKLMKKSAAGSSQCSLASNHTALCLHGMNWTFDKPNCNERLVE